MFCRLAAFALAAVALGQDLFLALRSAECPGGSLSACMDQCPTDPTTFQACVEKCEKECSHAPSPPPSPAPTPPGPTPPSPAPGPAPTPPSPTPPSPSPVPAGNCSIYNSGQYSQCNASCGSCFNAGARGGVLCSGGPSATGYLCPPDSQGGGDQAYACMDWTFGSQTMQAQETAFKLRAGEDVYFGIGTYGSDDDVQKGLGACYRIKVEGMQKDLLVQSINTGSDVAGNQFDLQVGDGGAGIFNTCAGSSGAMFPGPYSEDTWGHQYGGVDDKSQCKNLPGFPISDGPMKAAGDNLVALCEYGFDHGARGDGGLNPSISSIGRVECPEELVTMTQIQRNDDPSSYIPAKPLKAEHKCNLGQPGVQPNWCLTRMMDCRKPSGAWRSNVKPEIMVPGRKLVQTCAKDGYTRYDVECGCMNCYC